MTSTNIKRKICKICSEVQPAEVFHGLTCKTCYNKRQLENLSLRKKPESQSIKNKTLIDKQDEAIQKVAELLEMKDKIDSIVNKMTDMEEKVNELINVNKQLISMIDTTAKKSPAVNNTISPKATNPVAKSIKTKNQ